MLFCKCLSVYENVGGVRNVDVGVVITVYGDVGVASNDLLRPFRVVCLRSLDTYLIIIRFDFHFCSKV